MHLLKYVHETTPPKVLHRGGVSECELWGPFHHRVLRKVGANVSELPQFDNLLEREMQGDLDDCSHCRTRVNNWRHAFAKRMGDVPSFDAGMCFFDADIYFSMKVFTLPTQTKL